MKTDVVAIKVDESLAIMEWLGLADSDEYREGHLLFSEILRDNNCALWLFNYKQGRLIDKYDQFWTSDQWFPEALDCVKDGVKKIAVVISDDIFNKIAVRIITTRVSDYDVDLAFFNNEQEAKHWLLPEEKVAE